MTQKKRPYYLFLPRKWSRGEFLKWLRRVHGWLGCGIMPTAWGLPVKRDDQRWYRFGSDHPTQVQFCMGDGSVQKFRTQDGTGSGRWGKYIPISAMQDDNTPSLD